MTRTADRVYRRLLALTLLVSLQVLGIQVTAPFVATEHDDAVKTSAQSAFATLPLAFEPNLGQAEDSVDFLVHHGQAVTAFSSTGTTTSVGGRQVTMSLTGAAEQAFSGTEELPSKTNYFLGNDQSNWQSDIPNYGRLLAKDVYPGIDLAYYGTNSQLEHDFIVSPGADYKRIAFGFTGQDDLLLDDGGNLVLKAGDDTLTLNAPVTYQVGDHDKHTIPSSFELKDGTVTVAVADTYDPAKPLVIDPVLSLVYSTYLGGSDYDEGYSIASDPNGNIILSGRTLSMNFPTSTPYQAGNAGGAYDAFVLKLDPDGLGLVYSTYLGGTGGDEGYNVAVDFNGNAYLIGYTTSTDFPTASPFQAVHGGGVYDAFLTKINASGSALTYSTYLGGSGSDFGYDIALDAGGSAYVVGRTASTNFPTSSPIQGSNGGGYDVFLTKFTATGSALAYSTYIGGSNNDQASSIVLDATNNAYVAGQTRSVNFPTVAPYQAAIAGGADAFVTKVNASGSALAYSSYLGGGTGDDLGFGVAVDGDGNMYVMGNTASTDFPTVSPLQAANGGGYDVFLTKFTAAGSALTYSTYIGGSSTDFGYGFVIDENQNAFVAGFTNSTNFPTASAYQATYGGGPDDAFIMHLDATGSALAYSTFLGGSGDDIANNLIIDLSGNVYVTGYTGSTNFPTANAFQGARAGGNDAYITQLTEHTVDLEARVNPSLNFAVGSASCALGTLSITQTQQCTYTLSAATNGESGYAVSYLPAATLTSGGNTITALSSPTASTLNTEQFGLNLAANTAVGSHTAADFGAVPSGGSGTVAANYATANSFKFATAGDQVASSVGPSLATTYTVSTIANIGNTTEAGTYSTTITYNIVAGY